MNKIWSHPLAPFLALVLIIVPLFAQTIQNIDTSLVDWRDHAFIVWTMSQNVGHMQSLDFANFFTTNAFYPHTNTLFLSDLLLPQSVMMLPFVYVFGNLIAAFNVVLIITVILNSFAAYLLWKRVFGHRAVALVGSMLTTFSPFFHSNIYHFQMTTTWPFFLSMYFLLGDHKNKSNYILAGVFLSVQFIASAYLGVFLAFTIVLYLLVKAYAAKSLLPLKFMALVFLTFFVVDGVFIIGYMNARASLGVHTNYHEYVAYSAHLADYVFSKGINSIVHNLGPINSWNSFGQHGSAFPGFTVTALSMLALIKIRRKNNFFVGLEFSKVEIFFLLLIIIGFIFSLGPRLQVNGGYDHIPLPYHFIAKYMPFINSIRAPARWSFILYFGLTYFALKFVGRIRNKNIFALVALMVFLEYLPLGMPSEKGEYLDPKDYVLEEHCRRSPSVVLEIPVTHFDAGQTSIVEGLTYITKTQLASTHHKCILVNGYSGFDLPYIQDIKDNIYLSLIEGDSALFYRTIKGTGAELMVVNKEHMLVELKDEIEPALSILVSEGKIVPMEYGVYIIN